MWFFFRVRHAAWNSYPSWRPSEMCVRPCCHGNWHCQSTRSLPSSPSTPSSLWGRQGRSLHTNTHTHTQGIFNLQSIMNTLSIHFCIHKEETTTGRTTIHITLDPSLQKGQSDLYFSKHLRFCIYLNKGTALWGFTVCIISSNHHPEMSQKKKNGGTGCCLYCDSVGIVPFFTNLAFWPGCDFKEVNIESSLLPASALLLPLSSLFFFLSGCRPFSLHLYLLHGHILILNSHWSTNLCQSCRGGARLSAWSGRSILEGPFW